MEERIKELEEKMQQLEKRLNELEDFFSCQFCGEVDSLRTCYSCGKKVCKYCFFSRETKNYRGDTIIRHLCKHCN